MHTSITTLLTTLKLPTLSQADITTLNLLQRQWEQHAERLHRLRPEQVLVDQRAAYKVFLDDPTPDNEQKLVVLADAQLTGRRHAMLHDAYAELQRRIQSKIADILRPVLEKIHAAFQKELACREASAQSEGLNTRTDVGCIEMRRAVERIAHELSTVAEGVFYPQIEDKSPLDMAALLLQAGEQMVEDES